MQVLIWKACQGISDRLKSLLDGRRINNGSVRGSLG